MRTKKSLFDKFKLFCLKIVFIESTKGFGKKEETKKKQKYPMNESSAPYNDIPRQLLIFYVNFKC